MPSDYLTGLDAPLREVGQRVHAVVEAALPEATGQPGDDHRPGPGPEG
ncbi:hypothetical protein OG559_11250 [Micromonospora sp. NBC_01405]